MRIAVAALIVAGSLGVGPSAQARGLTVTTSFKARSATMPTPASVGAASATRDGERTDLPDALSGPQTHAIYFVPIDRRDERLDLGNGMIPRALRGTQSWFRSQMGVAPRIDRTRAGAFDITFMRARLQAQAYGFDSLIDEVRARGFRRPTKRYVIFAAVARGATCGESQYPLGPAPATGQYVVIWLDSAKECKARLAGTGTASTAAYTETIVAHEWLHAEGVVPFLAPRHCAGAVYHTCTGSMWLYPTLDPESHDVMFPYAGAPLRDKQLDRERNDYLDHALPHLRDLRASPFLG